MTLQNSQLIGQLRASYIELEEENLELREQVERQERQLLAVEGKMDQMLGVLNGAAFRALIEGQEQKMIKESGDGKGAVSNKIRGFVSLKKYRFQKDGFDLDLSYITPQIIAMGIPSEGVEAVYRNPMAESQRFFDTYHTGNYRIYNLCAESSRQYDKSKFDNQVVVYPFSDHNACPLALFKPFCDDMQAWLSVDPKRVAAVHCKAGKGRTGTMICAYLVHTGMCATADDAMKKFGTARTSNGKGVTIPSQRRFVRYYTDLVHSKFSMPVYMYTINSIRMSPVPSLHYSALGGGCTPFFHIYKCSGTSFHKIFDSSEHARAKRYKSSDSACDFTNLDAMDCSMMGTVKFQFFHATGKAGKGTKIFHFWLNTAFMPESGRLVLTKLELDKANHNKAFDDRFKLELFFEKEDEAPLTEAEYTLGDEGSAYQMKEIAEYLAVLNKDTAGEHKVHYNDEEWSDDEQEMMHEQSQRKLGLGGNDSTVAHRNDSRVQSEPEHPIGWVGEKEAANENEKACVIKEGWLNKKGGSRRNWKKRWVGGYSGGVPGIVLVFDQGVCALVCFTYPSSYKHLLPHHLALLSCRWFVLQVIGEGSNAIKVLSYYESSGANDPKGSILIDQGTMARNATDTSMSAKHAFSFEITHRGPCKNFHWHSRSACTLVCRSPFSLRRSQDFLLGTTFRRTGRVGRVDQCH
jgi:phosphatidylinositol-3,4,5-trisphosphate 3-phosphatase/dual-specificity protein phosphatase PTEN